MMRLEIPRIPCSPNDLLGYHWRHRARNNRLWQDEIHAATFRDKPREPYSRAQVRIDRRSKGMLDPDNLTGSVKPILDALRYAGILLDDTPKHLELQVTQTQSFKLPPRTLIEIDPLEPPHDRSQRKPGAVHVQRRRLREANARKVLGGV